MVRQLGLAPVPNQTLLPMRVSPHTYAWLTLVWPSAQGGPAGYGFPMPLKHSSGLALASNFHEYSSSRWPPA